jgi:hypothetical protein
MSDDFGKFIDRAQGGDRLESRFGGLESELDKFNPAAKKKARFLYQCRVFTVFRPWQECHRCQKAFRPKKNADGVWEDPELNMPDDEDYVCPHNENAEYIALVNRIAQGEVQLIKRAVDTLKTGVVQALIEWGEPTAKDKKEESEAFPRL